MSTAVYILLSIWLVLCIISTTIQILTGIKQYKHTKKIEQSMKDIDNMFESAFKETQRNIFLSEIEELKNENNKEEGEEENGRK